MKRLIAFAHAPLDPACRFRIGQYRQRLANAEWHVSLRTQHPPRPRRKAGYMCRRLWRLWDIRAASGYDVVFLNRDLLAGRIEYERLLLARNRRVVFDFDDAIYLGDKAKHVQEVCQRAAWVTVGNEHLAAFARQHSERVTVLPTVVDTAAYKIAAHAPRPGPTRVGWLGSNASIRETLFPHLEMLAALQAELDFVLVIVSQPRPEFSCPSLRWEFVEWSPHVETQIADLFDIGIMPLQDEAFQRGKCGCKLLQYMAAGLPAVASPVGINSQLLTSGERGFLARDPTEWRNALTALAADAALRQRMGSGSRAFVEREYSLDVWFPVLLDILERVRSGG